MSMLCGRYAVLLKKFGALALLRESLIESLSRLMTVGYCLEVSGGKLPPVMN
jgi:hypothetical protein